MINCIGRVLAYACGQHVSAVSVVIIPNDAHVTLLQHQDEMQFNMRSIVFSVRYTLYSKLQCA
jgi:hypothetical protein